MPRTRSHLSLRNLLLSNVRNKVFALVLSLVVWGAAYYVRGVDEDVVLQVQIAPPAGSVLLGETVLRGTGEDNPFNHNVTYKLRGQRGEINRVVRQKDTIIGHFNVVDESGDVYLDLRSAFPDLPPGVLIESADPAIVRCEVAVLVERDVPVIARHRSPNPVWIWSDAQTDPATVRVRGPADVVNDLQLTVTVDISGAKEEVLELRDQTLDELVGLGRFAPHVEFVGETEVNVKVTLRSALETRTIPGVRVKYGVEAGYMVIEAYSDRNTPLEVTGSPDAIALCERLQETGKLVLWVETKTIPPGTESKGEAQVGKFWLSPPVPGASLARPNVSYTVRRGEATPKENVEDGQQ